MGGEKRLAELFIDNSIQTNNHSHLTPIISKLIF